MVTPPMGDATPGSWRGRVFYELWVRSIQDSNGDGIGDFPGLTQRLDELASLGIGGIWLMPTFPSPLQDSGYDVSDYTAVHPDYGTMAQLQTFVREAHQKNILVYLDMVFNHTSDMHPWFQSALTGPQSPYYNYYIWANQPGTRCTDVPATTFGTKRWTYVPALKKYYFHQFYPRQPDLNFRNPKVREALLDVLRFWLDKGVDGFRFDVPDRYFERGDSCTFQPETLRFHAKMRAVITENGKVDRGFVGEIWGFPEDVKPYLDGKHDPMVFDFISQFASDAGVLIGSSPGPIVAALNLQAGIASTARWGLALGNHDTPRIADIAGGNTARLRLAAALQMTLPGVPFVWSGEELGLTMGTQVRIDWRDGSRTPYPWEPVAPGFGFTTGKPYLRFPADSALKAFAVQNPEPDSLLNWYRRLISLRNREPAFATATRQDLVVGHALWVFSRGKGVQKLWVAHNFSRDATVSWTPPWTGASVDLLYGTVLSPGALLLPPSGTMILRPHP